ncbi:MAG: hypothetical protein IJR01_00375 [Bacteroidales bacterium]|nr:hypothetical protein [Bacteroidales bacterium]
MKKNLLYPVMLCLGLFALAVSCSPQFFSMDLQLRRPSPSGYNLSGKSMGIVYVAAPKDTARAREMAEEFAASLEKDYFGGESVVGLYNLSVNPAADYASRDTLVNLVMDTDKDVIFLLDGSAKSQAARLCVYDSMAKTDTVKVYTANPTLDFDSFLSTWATETIVLYYYDSSEWDAPAKAAYNMKWHEAIKLWMALAKGKSGLRRACAAYNVAVAFYVMGDYNLSSEWLAASDDAGGTDFSNYLRSRLKAVGK